MSKSALQWNMSLWLCIGVFVLVCMFTPLPVVAQETFVPIQSLPGIDENSALDDYFTLFFNFVLGAAAVLGVVKLMLAGIQLMFSEVVPARADAKRDIAGALFGLLLVFGALTILNEINPSITQFSLFETDAVAVEVGCEAAGTCDVESLPDYLAPREGERLESILPCTNIGRGEFDCSSTECPTDTTRSVQGIDNTAYGGKLYCYGN